VADADDRRRGADIAGAALVLQALGMSLRALGRFCVALFALSTVFPLAAGVLNLSRASRWMGIADVVVATLLFCSTAAVWMRGRSAVSDGHRLVAFRDTQRVIAVIPALLAAYFLAGSRIDWAVLVIGLAWRGWLLLYTLPFLAAPLAAGDTPGAAPGPRAVDVRP
jgi:hypothetical protein